jgi:hypothetical protein
LTLLLVAAVLAGHAPAAEPNQAGRGSTFVYVSIAAEKRIAIYQMDRATGKLTPRGNAKLDGEPGALTVDPQRQFLFASLRSTGQLASFRIDRATGILTHFNTVLAGLDPSRSWKLEAVTVVGSIDFEKKVIRPRPPRGHPHPGRTPICFSLDSLIPPFYSTFF